MKLTNTQVKFVWGAWKISVENIGCCLWQIAVLVDYVWVDHSVHLYILDS